MLVAPLQEIAEGRPVSYTPPKTILTPSDNPVNRAAAQRFYSRQQQSAPLTKVGSPNSYDLGKMGLQEVTPETGGKLVYSFFVLSADLYTLQGMKILVSFIEISSPMEVTTEGFQYLSESDITAFETATTALMQKLCAEIFADDATKHAVRWTARTLLLMGSDTSKRPNEWTSELSKTDFAGVPRAWFQDTPETAPVQLDGGVRAYTSWGNSLVITPQSKYQFRDLRRSAVMAQYLWCFLSDIDSRSIRMLDEAAAKRVSFNSLDRSLTSVVKLNYRLAISSVLYERLGTESGVANRELVEATLDAWNYRRVYQQISERLLRLENIVQARTEILQKRSSRIMEIVLFVLSIMGLFSLVLGFIGTAYSGESGLPGEEEWYPGGAFIDLFRALNPDWLFVGTLVVCIALIAIVFLHRRLK